MLNRFFSKKTIIEQFSINKRLSTTAPFWHLITCRIVTVGHLYLFVFKTNKGHFVVKFESTGNVLTKKYKEQKRH